MSPGALTIDRDLAGGLASVSFSPDADAQLVRYVRRLERLLADGEPDASYARVPQVDLDPGPALAPMPASRVVHEPSRREPRLSTRHARTASRGDPSGSPDEDDEDVVHPRRGVAPVMERASASAITNAVDAFQIVDEHVAPALELVERAA